MTDPKDTLGKLLEYVGHSPLRLIMVIVMGIFAMSMWFVYTEKDAFMNSYRAQKALPHMNGKYDEAAGFILKKGNADLVVIFEVNPIVNSRKIVYVTLKGEGRVKSYDGFDVGLFTKDQGNNNDVISLMTGKIPCGEYTKPQSYIGFFYIEKGIRYTCRVSIPPDPSKFIGQITFGWKEKPDDIEAMQTVIRIASELLWN
jgi:hypothetical protein